jgi:hypothetical protein
VNFDPNTAARFPTKPITFGELAKDYIPVEMVTDQSNAAIPKAHSTVESYKRNINRHILPRCGHLRAHHLWDAPLKHSIIITDGV